MAYRILIVDDEHELQNMVKEILTQAGYETDAALSCAQALERFQAGNPDAVLLDVNLPDGDGFSLFGQLRESRDVPVLFLSARDEDADRLLGLGLGADDYITKPFNTLELLARIKVQLRKEENKRVKDLTYKDLILKQDSHYLYIGNQKVSLTRTEYAILKQLMLNPKKVITKTKLLEEISDETLDCDENALKVHISNLRKKIKTITPDQYIESVWGIGFKMYD